MRHLDDIPADRPALDILADTESEGAGFRVRKFGGEQQIFQPDRLFLAVRDFDADQAAFVIYLYVDAVLRVEAHRKFVAAPQNARRGDIARYIDLIAGNGRPARDLFDLAGYFQRRQRFDDGFLIPRHLFGIQ